MMIEGSPLLLITSRPWFSNMIAECNAAFLGLTTIFSKRDRSHCDFSCILRLVVRGLIFTAFRQRRQLTREQCSSLLVATRLHFVAPRGNQNKSHGRQYDLKTFFPCFFTEEILLKFCENEQTCSLVSLNSFFLSFFSLEFSFGLPFNWRMVTT